ncbi:BtrH N-terminal domain-containing protein [Paenibacillus sp. FJAT-26967]|uniref:BtrH N-terminal domain-containing protein n=1 Tax=Paenibacillus sp. FJAT-26967 TaxID=1729690 RepID=UPI0008391924|nr:BtrH N-terminal domain-containing protein [Paenibacillus sp. FJAT-26967]
MKVLNGIDCIFDQYLYDEHGLNCFLAPKYLATQTFNQEYPDLFYLYFYLFFHYNFNPADRDAPRLYHHDLDSIESYLLKEKLGLEMADINIEDNLVEKIEENLTEGRPVFVPVSKKAIFYCEEYLRNDHPHLILVKGYDRERRRFVIQDGEQLVSLTNSRPYPALRTKIGDVCSEFYMLYETLESGFDMYKESFVYMDGSIKAMRAVKAPAIDSSLNALIDISDMIMEFAGNEEHFIQSKLEYLAHSDNELIMAYISSQKILFNILNRFISMHDQDPSHVEHIRILMNECSGLWKKLTNIIVLNTGRRKAGLENSSSSMINSLSDEIMEMEIKLLKDIAKIGAALKTPV